MTTASKITKNTNYYSYLLTIAFYPKGFALLPSHFFIWPRTLKTQLKVFFIHPTSLGIGCKDLGIGCSVSGIGYTASGSGCKDLGIGCEVLGIHCGASGSGCWALGIGF